MTDRINSLAVVLESDMRADDAEELMSAIRQLRGVISVSGNVSDVASHIAQERARRELADKLWDVLYTLDRQ